MRPGVLAVRAANEYRSRDLFSYLGIRYYLEASSAKLDKWTNDIASELTYSRTTQPYRYCQVYKGIDDRNKTIEYRALHFPAPNEMLAEASLLNQCSLAGNSFSRRDCVFSNVLANGDSRSGMVDPYFKWWKARQIEIAKAAKNEKNAIVLYLDIKKFYPSVSKQKTLVAWKETATAANLSRKWLGLGEKIIFDYAKIRNDTGGLLMGPMFAHVLGNCVLGKFDDSISKSCKAYFRYVDDLAFVIPQDQKNKVLELVRGALPEGLVLNEAKTHELTAAEWTRWTNSFQKQVGVSLWVRLIGDLKHFLVSKPNMTRDLAAALKDSGFRITLKNYSKAVQERTFLERLKDRMHQPWFRRGELSESPKQFLFAADFVRQSIQSMFERAIAEPLSPSGMMRKLQLQRIRYTATRLLYLAKQDALKQIEDYLGGIVELSELASIFAAVRSRDVTNLLAFSGVVAHAAGQVLNAGDDPVTCRERNWTPEMTYAWAALKAVGVKFKHEAAQPSQDQAIVNFANENRAARSAATEPYFGEMFSLFRNSKNSHAQILHSALDASEEAGFDAISMLRMSS